MVSLVGLVLAIMFITMILQKRKPVRQALAGNLPQTSLHARLAQYWHHFAIAGVVLLWIFSVFNRLLAGDQPGGYLGVKTLLIIPLYFLLDWILRRILEAAFGIVQKPTDPGSAAQTARNTEPGATVETRLETRQQIQWQSLPPTDWTSGGCEKSFAAVFEWPWRS